MCLIVNSRDGDTFDLDTHFDASCQILPVQSFDYLPNIIFKSVIHLHFGMWAGYFSAHPSYKRTKILAEYRAVRSTGQTREFALLSSVSTKTNAKTTEFDYRPRHHHLTKLHHLTPLNGTDRPSGEIWLAGIWGSRTRQRSLATFFAGGRNHKPSLRGLP